MWPLYVCSVKLCKPHHVNKHVRKFPVACQIGWPTFVLFPYWWMMMIFDYHLTLYIMMCSCNVLRTDISKVNLHKPTYRSGCFWRGWAQTVTRLQWRSKVLLEVLRHSIFHFASIVYLHVCRTLLRMPSIQKHHGLSYFIIMIIVVPFLCMSIPFLYHFPQGKHWTLITVYKETSCQRGGHDLCWTLFCLHAYFIFLYSC